MHSTIFSATHAPDPADADRAVPAYSEIPAEFTSGASPWCAWQQEWCFTGFQAAPEPKPGVNKTQAWAAVKAIQMAFHLDHRHRDAAVAYLASQWFLAPGPVSIATSGLVGGSPAARLHSAAHHGSTSPQVH